MNRPFAIGVALALIWGSSSIQAAAVTADIAVIMDESGSMGGEQAWISGAISDLETSLIGAGVGANPNPANQYALVGFGASANGGNPLGIDNTGRGNTSWMSDSQFGTAAGFLQTTGGTEDGYEAISFFFSNYSLRTNAATNVILVTDEDRDNTSGDTFDSVLAQLKNANGLLNVVVDAVFRDDVSGDDLLGIDSDGIGYLADGIGGFTTVSSYSFVRDSGTTREDYVDLALATGGAAWNLNQLRAGGLTAQSFSAAFTAIKTEEIIEQVPVPGSLSLLGLGLFGLASMHRRRSTRT